MSTTGRSSPPARGDTGTRLIGLDAARGLALAGMIAVNVGPTEATSLLHRMYLLPYGRASILFVVIAGIGMGFLAGRAHGRTGPRPGLWPAVLWRAGLLVVGGFALQSLTDDIGVILPLYGALFLLAPLLGLLSDRAVVVVAGAMLVLGPVLVIAHDLVTGPTPGGNAPVQLGDPPVEAALDFLFAGRYPLVTWVVPFLVGLLLARVDLGDRGAQRRLMIWGAVVAVGGLVLSEVLRSALGAAADEGFTRLLTGVAHGQMPLWLVSSIAGAAAVVAAMIRLGQAVPALLGPLAACGRLSLTIYVLHILVLVAITPDGGFTFPEGVAVTAGLVAGSVAFALVWQRWGGVGPLERLMRPPWARATSVRPPAVPASSAPERDPA